jgi:DHA1 family multidrug resistance protein-like MFS transporter
MVERPASSASDETKSKIPDDGDDKSPRDAAPSTAQDVSQSEGTREFVTWDGPDDPENPKNWSYAYKWWITIIMCILCLDV